MENNYPGNYDVEILQMVFTPRDLIKLHIRDLNHVVTDEDLRRLSIGSNDLPYSVGNIREGSVA